MNITTGTRVLHFQTFATSAEAAEALISLTPSLLVENLAPLEAVAQAMAVNTSPAALQIQEAYVKLVEATDPETGVREEALLRFSNGLRDLPPVTWVQFHSGKTVTRFADAMSAARELRANLIQLQSANPSQVDPDALIATVDSMTQETLPSDRASYLDILRALFPFMILNLSRLNGVGQVIEEKGLKEHIRIAMFEVSARMAMEIEREMADQSAEEKARAARTVFDAVFETLLWDDETPEEFAEVVGQVRGRWRG